MAIAPHARRLRAIWEDPSPLDIALLLAILAGSVLLALALQRTSARWRRRRAR